jgi:hypothetical protein
VRLVALSGDHLRDLLRTLAEIVWRARVLPVGNGVVDSAVTQIRSEALLVSRTKRAELDDVDRLPDLARILDTRLMLCHRNGSEWYDVHPLLRDEVSRQVEAVRDAIRRHLPGGLTHALHTSMKSLVRDAAPDLWSVRSLVVEVHQESGPRPQPWARRAAERRSAPLGGTVGVVGTGQITSRTGRTNESGRLLEASEASLQDGRPESSIGQARQAVTLLALPQLSLAEEADVDRAAAEGHAEQALALLAESDGQFVASLLGRLSSLAEARGDLPAAEAAYAEAAALRARLA